MKNLLVFLFIVELSLMSSKTITSSDLKDALSKASAGDIIQLNAGTYSSVPYTLKSGMAQSPITIRAVTGAKVIFTGTSSSCIFDFYGISYVNIEGPFELKNAFCGVKAMNVNNVKISGLTVHNTQQHGIVISGENNEVSGNEVYDCVMENKATAKTITSGWSQCVAAWSITNTKFSKNILFENNYIHDAWGEGLDFLKCDGCSAIKNNITNGFSMNIYLDASKNSLIEGNILRVTSSEHDTVWGGACGVGLASESGNEYKIENIVIQNNVMIGTRMGVYFFQLGPAGYTNIKILHNTLWLVSVNPFWFQNPNNSPAFCELRNNFAYFDWFQEFAPKSAWTIGNNYYYNYEEVPYTFADTVGGSRAARTMDLNTIFNNKNNKCNYNDKNLDVECLRPSSTPNDWLKLYRSGSKPSIKVEKDFSGCTRSTTTPSIGAFEFSEGCTENSQNQGTGGDTTDLQVKFRMNYCTSESVKIVGDFCSWNVLSCPTLSNEGNCNWSYTFTKPKASMTYKFVIANGGSASRWENDPNRTFNLASLKSYVNSSSSGTYQSCSYSKSGSLVTLNCSWK